MALMECKDCGNEHSTTAKACPKCGKVRPISLEKYYGLIGYTVLSVPVYFAYKLLWWYATGAR